MPNRKIEVFDSPPAGGPWSIHYENGYQLATRCGNPSETYYRCPHCIGWIEGRPDPFPHLEKTGADDLYCRRCERGMNGRKASVIRTGAEESGDANQSAGCTQYSYSDHLQLHQKVMEMYRLAKSGDEGVRSVREVLPNWLSDSKSTLRPSNFDEDLLRSIAEQMIPPGWDWNVLPAAESEPVIVLRRQ